MEKDNLVIKKLLDKANKCDNINYQVHTDFLNLYEQSLFLSHLSELPAVNYMLVGGFVESERKFIIFYPFGWEKEDIVMPYSIIKIAPLSKAPSKKLTHRDYLGAILNLSIKREKIGDILIQETNAYVCCQENMTAFIMDQLSTVGNTTVSTSRAPENTYLQLTLDYRVISNTIASNRIDNILKICLSQSRTKVVELIKAKKVFLNSQLIENTSAKVLPGTVISVRGFGKFKLCSIGEQTKKGRFHIEINQYI